MDAVCARSRRALRVLLSLPKPHFQAAFQGGRRAAPVVHSETRQAERLATGLVWAAAESVTILQERSWMLLQTFSWTEPTAVCPCGRGECHRMRTGTATCHGVQPEQGWWGSSWSIWPSSGHGGDVGPLEMAQREHEEG